MKLLIAALLAVFSTSVMAEWTKIIDGNTGTDTIYADHSTIRKSGNKVKMWLLYDTKVAQTVEGMRYLSMSEQDEYDCKEETRRVLALIAYSKNMGAGEVVHTTGAIHEEPRPIPPGSMVEGIFKVACGK